MLFMDVTHLSGLYEGTILAAMALDTDNHIFDVAYAVVGRETNEDWLWFLTMLHNCLGGSKPVIMSYRNKELLTALPLVFRKKNHCYYVRHLTENLMGEASKLGIRSDASKELEQDMFNRVAYATSAGEYDSAMAELRRYKRKLDSMG